MAFISADITALRAYSGRLAQRAADVRALSRRLNSTSFGISDSLVPAAWAAKGEAVNDLNEAARALDLISDQVSRYAAAIWLAEQRINSALFPGGAWIQRMIARSGQGRQRWTGRTSFTGAGKLAVGFTFVDAELGLAVTSSENADGTVTLVITDVSGLGLSAEVGAEGTVGTKTIGGSAGLAALLEGKESRVFTVQPGDVNRVLALEAARRAMPGDSVPGVDMPRPQAVISQLGLIAGGAVEFLKYEKGIEVSVARTERADLDRNGRVTGKTLTNMISGSGAASLLGVGGGGAVEASISIIRDKRGKVIGVEVVQAKEVTAGATGSSETTDKGTKNSSTSSVGASSAYRSIVAHTLDVRDNRVMQAEVAALADDPVLNAKALARLAQQGVTVTEKERVDAMTMGLGFKLAAGAKIEVNATVSGAQSVVTSSASSMPRG